MINRPLRLSLSRVLFPAIFFTAIGSTQAVAGTQVWLSQPDRMADTFLDDLSHAKKRIDLLLPDLQDRVLFEELQTIARKKKLIRIILSTKEDGLKSWQCIPCSALESEGIDIKYTDVQIPSGYAIIDGPRTRHSSGRFGKVLAFQGKIATGEGKELIKISKSGDYVLNFQDEFNYIWSKSSNYGDRSRQKKTYKVRVPAVPGVFFSSANMVPVKTPKGWLMTPSLDNPSGVIENFVEGAVNYAFRTVDISAPSLKNPAMIKAALNAQTRGVKVRIIVDRKEYSGIRPAHECELQNLMKNTALADECLAAQGIQVIYRTQDIRREPGSSNGYVIIDQKLVLAGPVGMATTDEFNSLQHMIVIRDSARETYSRDFSLQMAHAIRLSKTFVNFKK